jgi:hypothetical protein
MLPPLKTHPNHQPSADQTRHFPRLLAKKPLLSLEQAKQPPNKSPIMQADATSTIEKIATNSFATPFLRARQTAETEIDSWIYLERMERRGVAQ